MIAQTKRLANWRFLALLLVISAVAASASSVLAQAPGGNDRQFDHIGNFNFKVEIEGVTVGPFSVVEGFESTTEVIEFRDGDSLAIRKRPGLTSYSNITLKRGYTGSTELWQWYKATADGLVERKAGSIILLSSNFEEIERYNFFEAWPMRYKNYEVEGNGSGVLVEEIEIAVEKIERG